MAEALSEKEVEDLNRLGAFYLETNRKDMFEKLKKAADSDKASIPEKRGEILKALLSDKNMRSSLKEFSPDLYKEGLKAERGKDWKMSLKDVSKALESPIEDLLKDSKWMHEKGTDLKFELEREGLDWKEALKLLRDAQTQKDRADLWEKEPWYNRAVMSFAAPLTSEDLSKGKPVDDIYTADYVGMGANLVPYGQIFKGLGPIARTTAELAIPSVLEGATSVVADDVPVSTALENTGKNVGMAGSAAGLLKGGYKGINFIQNTLTKSGKQMANATEDALKEGFYRADLEKRIKNIQKMINKGQRPSDSDLELLTNFNMLKDLGVDLSTLGQFSNSKLQTYLSTLKKDPLKYTEKARAEGKLGANEDLFARRQAIRENYDPVDQFKFDNNPGKITFTDLLLESPQTKFKLDYETGKIVPSGKHLDNYGWAPKAGFGKVRKEIKGASLQNHPGISGSERPSFASQIIAGEKAGLSHTDPYYPRSLDVNKAAEDMMLKYPQLKPYFSKMYKDPTTRDFLFDEVIPYFWRRLMVETKTESDKKKGEE